MSWKTVRTIARDRTRFTVPGLGRYDESNRHGDALDIYREDYSLVMSGDGSGPPPALALGAKVRKAWPVVRTGATGGPAQTGKVVGSA